MPPSSMSARCKSSHSGFLDVSRRNGGLRISGWVGQLSELTYLLITLLLHCVQKKTFTFVLNENFRQNS